MADDVNGQHHDPSRRGFASDNYAGAHSEILDALAIANGGHVGAYGGDPYTAAAVEVLRGHFGADAEVFFVFNGTGANVLSLQAMTKRWDAVICAESAHINLDECGAAEKVAGLKLLSVATPDGKLTPSLIDVHAWGWGDVHHVQPHVVSITQSTELGTLYTPEEIAAICAHAHSLGMFVHVDGARIANAAAALGVPLRAFTTDVGVDVVSLGGTKNGLLYGEGIVVLNPDAVSGVEFLRKAGMQLSSKMRFIGVQFQVLFGTDLWLRSATHANAMARRLADAVADVAGVKLTREPEVNSVYAILPAESTARLQEQYFFYPWDRATGEVRWVCAFDTTEQDVDDFAEAIRKEMASFPSE